MVQPGNQSPLDMPALLLPGNGLSYFVTAEEVREAAAAAGGSHLNALWGQYI